MKKPLEAGTTVTDATGVSFSASASLIDALTPLRRVDVDRYELRGEYGRGGLGVVMRALDRQLGREVAIKLLQNPSPSAGARFLREATITSRLQHPSIVTVLDVVSWTDGTPSYTMPLYPGRSLREAIDAAPELAERLSLLPSALAVAEAIAHAHGRKVIHRDIKPSNVLLGPLGETVVIDWGLAKSLDDGAADDDSLPSLSGSSTGSSTKLLDETRAGDVLGTPAYMAPEQASGARVDERADVYSLGGLLYHVLAGRPPYRGSSSEQVIQQLIQGPPADLREVAPAAPPELIAIVRKAMARAPGDRYADAGALAGDLRRFLSGHLVEAHAYTPAQLFWRWLARHRVLAAVVTVALATVVTIAIVSFRRVERERAVAQDAAARETARANALILTQAETALQTDPTAALAWLKTYPTGGDDWARVRAIGRDAVRRGVSRHIYRGSQEWMGAPLVRDGGRSLLLMHDPRTLLLWDVATGERRNVCLPGDLARGKLRDDARGGELVTALVDGRILVWNPELTSWAHVATVPFARGATLSSDGRYIVVARDDVPAVLIDRASGLEGPLADGEAKTRDALFVPGTSRVLLLDGRRAQLYDVAEQRVVFSAAPGVTSAMVSPHGRHAILSRRGDGVVEWLDAETLETRALRFGTYFISPLDFLADGRVVLAGRGKATPSVLWDPRSGKVEELAVLAGAIGVAPSGAIVAAFDREARVWIEDLETHELRALRGHAGNGGRIVELVNDELLATVIDTGELRLWDLTGAPAETVRLGRPRFEPPYALTEGAKTLILGAEDGRVLRRRLDGVAPAEPLFALDGPPSIFAGTSDGHTVLAVTQDGALVRFDRRSGRLERLFSDVRPVQSLQVTDDGRYAAGLSFHDKTVQVWDLERKLARRLELIGACFSIELSPDQRTLAISCTQGDAVRGFTLHDLASGESRLLAAREAELQMLGYSPSGRYLFGASLQGQVLRWDVATGALTTRQIHRGSATGGHVLSDELFVSAGSDGLRLSWFSPGVSRVVDGSARVMSTLSSPDGRFVGGQSLLDESIKVWDLVTGERWSVARFTSVEGMGLTHDGRLVTSSRDGAVRLHTPDLKVATPDETKAWLDAQTSVRLDAPVEPSEVCP